MKIDFMKPLLYIIVLALVANQVSILVQSGSSSTTKWVLVWSDEFNEPVINESVWSFEVGNGCPDLCGWGNNELEYYKKENAFIEFDKEGNGYLVIEARSERVYDNVSGRYFNYTSARMHTRNSFTFTYGRIEVRAKLPYGKGIWPAIWLLGTKGVWPACGEIDIMELLGHQPDTVYGTVHTLNCAGSNGIGASFRLPANMTFSDDFHVFALEWSPQAIKWYVDDQLYHVVSREELADKGCVWVFDPDNPFYIILNVAVGGNWPGYPDSSTVFPQRMIVDYVRVYTPENGFNPLVENYFNTFYDSDNELLSRTTGWISAPTPPLSYVFNTSSGSQGWLLKINDPSLSGRVAMKFDAVSLVISKPQSSLPYPGVWLGNYIWLKQGRSYEVKLTLWSNETTQVELGILLPSIPVKQYFKQVLTVDEERREYVIEYKHSWYSGNIVFIYLAMLGKDSVELHVGKIEIAEKGLNDVYNLKTLSGLPIGYSRETVLTSIASLSTVQSGEFVVRWSSPYANPASLICEPVEDNNTVVMECQNPWLPISAGNQDISIGIDAQGIMLGDGVIQLVFNPSSSTARGVVNLSSIAFSKRVGRSIVEYITVYNATTPTPILDVIAENHTLSYGYKVMHDNTTNVRLMVRLEISRSDGTSIGYVDIIQYYNSYSQYSGDLGDAFMVVKLNNSMVNMTYYIRGGRENGKWIYEFYPIDIYDTGFIELNLGNILEAIIDDLVYTYPLSDICLKSITISLSVSLDKGWAYTAWLVSLSSPLSTGALNTTSTTASTFITTPLTTTTTSPVTTATTTTTTPTTGLTEGTAPYNIGGYLAIVALVVVSATAFLLVYFIRRKK